MEMPDGLYRNEERGSLGVDQFIQSVAHFAATGLCAVEIRICGGRLEVAVCRAAGGVYRDLVQGKKMAVGPDARRLPS